MGVLGRVARETTMLRFILLGLAAVVIGMMGGWMFSAEMPGNLSTVAPADISSAHRARTVNPVEARGLVSLHRMRRSSTS